MSSEANSKDKDAESGGVMDTLRVIFHALILALIVRIFFYQPFNIPSGSMIPTLLIGDYLFVSKLSYGYSKYSFPSWFPHLFDGRVLASEPHGSSPTKSGIRSRDTARPLMCSKPSRICTRSPGSPITRLM